MSATASCMLAPGVLNAAANATITLQATGPERTFPGQALTLTHGATTISLPAEWEEAFYVLGARELHGSLTSLPLQLTGMVPAALDPADTDSASFGIPITGDVSNGREGAIIAPEVGTFPIGPVVASGGVPPSVGLSQAPAFRVSGDPANLYEATGEGITLAVNGYSEEGKWEFGAVPIDCTATHSGTVTIGPTSGSSGSTGTGPTGTSGESEGSSGETGGRAPGGTSGSTGVTGPTSPTGTSGSTGTTGSSGPSGATGPTGPVGETGPTGTSGVTGTSGSSGASGSSGTSGVTGETGPTGTTTSPSPPSEGTSGSNFQPGLNSGTNPQFDIPGAAMLGAKVVRLDVDISSPASSFASAIEAYAAKGIRVLPLADFYGTMPSAADAHNLAGWVAAYGPGGSFWKGKSYPSSLAVTDIEFGNETSYGYQYHDNAGEPSYTERAKTYAVRFKEAAEAISQTGIKVGLLAQADDRSGDWVNEMYAAVPNLTQYVAGWTIHPYVEWQHRIQGLINQTAAHGAPASIPIDITEWGVDTDNGRCLQYNYEWSKCMTYQEAGEALRSTVHGIHGMLGNRLGYFMLYQVRDQRLAGTSTEFEAYFGALQHELQPKGAYTTAVEELFAGQL